MRKLKDFNHTISWEKTSDAFPGNVEPETKRMLTKTRASHFLGNMIVEYH